MENVMGIIENRDAQFMLLGGFIIAIGLVITTVMLNNIIFQGNMAGEAGADPVKYDMVNLMQITGDEMKSAYNYSNGTTNLQKIANFSREMQNFSANLSMIYALHGEGVNVSNDTSNWNNNNYANFTDNGTAGGAANWIVIQNVSSSNITVNVTSGTFNINLTNSTPDTQIVLNAPNTYKISNSSGTPYAIIFINGAGAAGNYSISGTASGRAFIRSRDYILYATVALSTSRMRANITIPVSVPW
jgi:hypothetical protein